MFCKKIFFKFRLTFEQIPKMEVFFFFEINFIRYISNI